MFDNDHHDSHGSIVELADHLLDWSGLEPPEDGEQLLRQFKRFCSNWLHVFQARDGAVSTIYGWRYIIQLSRYIYGDINIQ